MKDRSPLRLEVAGKDRDVKLDKQYQNRTVQLEAIESLIIKGFNNLIRFLDNKTTKTEVINQLKEIATPDVEKVVKAVEKLDKTTLSTKIDLKPVLEALKSLQTEISAVPGKIEIEKTEQVKVNNLDEIKFDTSDLEKAIKALDLKVDVKAPIIKTEKIELKPLQDIMLDLLKAFNKFKVEPTKEVKVSNLKDIKPTDTTDIEKKLDTGNKYLKEISEKKFGGGGGGGNSTPYTDSEGRPKTVVLQDDKVPVSSGKEYEFSDSDDANDPSYTGFLGRDGRWFIKKYTDSAGTMRFTKGSSNYATNWTNRASLTYDYYDVIF